MYICPASPLNAHCTPAEPLPACPQVEPAQHLSPTLVTSSFSQDESRGVVTGDPALYGVTLSQYWQGYAEVVRGALKGAIDFRDVSFSYPGQSEPSLRNLNFSIKPGEKVAILGRIGSGKTTLEKLILGLYLPTQGAVLVDGIDLRQLDPAELRRQIGYVQQDVMLFYGSLRDNIIMGAPLADDAAIVKAAEIGGILNLVNQHPKGFDMLVGERGESLSGGQRQGVAIARAVINDPPILLLDEPTSSMDFSSEDDIKRRLTEYAKGKTVILISHRTSLLDLADRIIVIDGGRIMADGPKEQVVTALRQGRIGKAA